MSDTDKLKQEYWEAYKNYVEQQSNLCFRPQKPLPQHWTNVAIGTSDAIISACTGRNKKDIAVDLNIYSNEAKAIFDKLYEDCYEDSKTAISDNIEWLRMDDKKSSYILLEGPRDYHDKDDWQRQFAWLYEMTSKYVKFFKPRLKKLK